MKSAYSLLENANSLTEIIKSLAKKGYEDFALADHNNMFASYKFEQLCKELKKQAIIGLTLELNGLKSRSLVNEILLIAKSDLGLKNLVKISSMKMTETEEHPLEFNDLKDYLTDVFVIFTEHSELTRYILLEEKNKNEAVILYREFLQNHEFFLAIDAIYDHEYNQQKLVEFSQAYNIPLIALVNVDYINADDYFKTEVLKALQKGEKIENPIELAKRKGKRVLLTEQQVREQYLQKNLLSALKNNDYVAKNAKANYQTKRVALPKFKTPDNISSIDYLNRLVTDGLQYRLNKKDLTFLQKEAYKERKDKELAVINKLGFADYFLIVWDIINYCLLNDIQIGAGRGSAAGSLVAWALKITDVDPIEYDLLFERFLNEDRVSMPDIDIDLPDNKREDVLNYLHNKYGNNKFAQILTFTSFSARQVIRDVCRILNISQEWQKKLSKSLPKGANITLKEAWDKSQAFQILLKTMPLGDLLLQTVAKLEGLPRNISVHAAGIVLSDNDISDQIPVLLNKNNRLLTQFEKKPVEKLGLLKIDLLGLRNLTVLANIIKTSAFKEREKIDISEISMTDKKTLELFKNGETNGIFQFESEGIRNVLRLIQADSFELITAANALYRPGPIENIPQFAKIRKNPQEMKIIDVSVADILRPTFGIIVYQEQVMRVAEAYAGFNLRQADILRSSISNKDLNKMEELKKAFYEGANKLNRPIEHTEKIYALIEEFANYGFNKSHAVAYSKMAYELAYLKANYPLYFYAEILNNQIGAIEKTNAYLREIKKRKIEIKGPNVNSSNLRWRVDEKNNAIQMGLLSIQKLKLDLARHIVKDRYENGPYQTVNDFMRRLPAKLRSEDDLIALIKSGAMDRFGYNRNTLLNNIQALIQTAEFGNLDLEIKFEYHEELSNEEKINGEKEYLHTSISLHPTAMYETYRKRIGAKKLVDLIADNKTATVVVNVDSIRQIKTKKGTPMAFLTVSDEDVDISVVVFPDLYAHANKLLDKGKILEISGKVETSKKEENTLQIVAQNIKEIDQHNQDQNKPVINKTWYLQLDNDEYMKTKLMQILLQYPGKIPVILKWTDENEYLDLDKQYWINDSKEVFIKLVNLLGENNVVLKRN